MKRSILPIVTLAFAIGCHQAPHRPNAQRAAAPRPAVIPAGGGEKRFLRGGTAPLFIKVDPVNTGSHRMVLGSSDLPPGDAIGIHRHLQEDEIIVITRGTARFSWGKSSSPRRLGERSLYRRARASE